MVVPCMLAPNPSTQLESQSARKGNPQPDSFRADTALASGLNQSHQVTVAASMIAAVKFVASLS